MTIKKLQNIEKIVKSYLEINERCRNDDFFLYSRIIEDFYPPVAKMPFTVALEDHHELGIPNFESVRRCRQKVQAKNPHLVSERTKAKREKEEEVYREWAMC